ncbi:MAG TPA: hypothetical protein VFJ98_01200 [Mycobacteriales bacterium]|nr:hypothetical protein [Mycobacteriales bacterium]
MGRLVLRAYGRTVAVEAPADALDTVRRRLPATYVEVDREPERLWSLRREPSGMWMAYDDDGLGGGVDVADGAEMLLSSLELWVAEHAKDRIFVHAGCAVRAGRAIVLPGRTMSGKSSLAAALVRAGATYFSDEFAVLDRRGRVHPYPRPLSIRPYDGSARQRVRVQDLGGSAGSRSAEVAVIAHLRYHAGESWDVAELSPGRAALALIDNTVAARSRPRAMLTAVSRASVGARALAGRRGDADQAARHLLDLLG